MTRVLRVPQVNLAALLAEPNPQIDLKLEPYEKSTKSFLQAVSAYKNRSIALITQQRAHQANEKKKIADRTLDIENQVNQLKIREIELLDELSKEEKERKSVDGSVAALKRRQASLQEKCASIEADIEQLKAITANLRRERSKESSTLNTHAARVAPEVDAYERALACIIEGVEKDRILVRFYCLDPADAQREFSFVLDVGETHKVITSSPVLPSLPMLIDELNGSRDLYQFIKRVRIGYQELVQAGC